MSMRIGIATFGVLVVGLAATAAPALAGDGTFVTYEADVGAGSQPSSVAVGDFNGDGDPDLAVVNWTGFDVSVRLGAAGGSFTDVPDVYTAESSYDVAVGDFDADGKQDLAVARANHDTVEVRLGDGGGTFHEAPDVTLDAHLDDVVVGDFDADGDEDLAVAEISTDSVAIRLGTGDGTFTTAATSPPDLPVGHLPDDVAVGDFNADGDQDLAVTNVYGDTVSIRLGAAGAAFTNAADVPVGDAPTNLAVGDFNADGDDDLAVVKPNDDAVVIRLGADAATFTPVAAVPVAGDPSYVAIGDFNTDGDQDLAVTSADRDAVSIRLGAAGAMFTNGSDVPVGNAPSALAVGDFNVDGNEDLAVANFADDDVSIRLGAGTPRLDGNLLQNGGFEDLSETAPDPIAGWQRTGNMIDAPYLPPTDRRYPDRLDAAQVEGGERFLSSAFGAGASASQTVSVADRAAGIDAGPASATLSAHLGGGASADRMLARATFLDDAGAELGAFEIGPVTAAERNNRTILLHRTSTQTVPVGTRQIKVSLIPLHDGKFTLTT